MWERRKNPWATQEGAVEEVLHPSLPSILPDTQLAELCASLLQLLNKGCGIRGKKQALSDAKNSKPKLQCA